MIPDNELLQMTKEELLRLPQSQWSERYTSVVRPQKEGLSHWICEDPDLLPCSGERKLVENREGTPLRVVIYRPEGIQDALPVYFHMHGGGYNKGYPETNDYECSYYSQHASCMVISVGYRLAPEHPFPCSVNDCYDVISYFAEHAEQYGIDPMRIALGGESAGGGLACAVSMLAAKSGVFSPCAQLLVCPGVNNHDIPGQGASLIYHLTNILSYCTYEQTEDPLVSPLLAADEQLRTLPFTVLLTAGKDDWCAADMAFAKRLVENGVPVTLRQYPNCRHCFHLHWPDYCDMEYAADAIDFLAQQLRSHFMTGGQKQ